MSFGVEREMKESGEKGGTEDAANLQSFTKVMLRTDQELKAATPAREASPSVSPMPRPRIRGTGLPQTASVSELSAR